MKLSTKLSLGLDKSILGTLKLPDIDLHIIEEIKQYKPTIQVIQKKTNNKPFEIDGPLF